MHGGRSDTLMIPYKLTGETADESLEFMPRNELIIVLLRARGLPPMDRNKLADPPVIMHGILTWRSRFVRRCMEDDQIRL